MESIIQKDITSQKGMVVDKLRESPSITLIELLKDCGAGVYYNDPCFPTITPIAQSCVKYSKQGIK